MEPALTTSMLRATVRCLSVCPSLLLLNCIVLIVLVLISFSHGYSAILSAKLMIKLDLDLRGPCCMN